MKTKRSLLTSCLSLLLCFAMLMGTTFAWFTDAVTSSGNVIKTGNLDIVLKKGDLNENGEWTWTENQGEAIFDYDKWEPGYTTFAALAVENVGSLDARITAKIVLNGTPTILGEVIDVYTYVGGFDNYDPSVRPDFADGNWQTLGTIADLVNGTGTVLPARFLNHGQRARMIVALHMREDAGNEYQNMDLGANFDIKVLATQATSESDSFDDQYDADAEWPETNEGFETTASLNQVQTTYGALANDFIIRYSDSVYALLPAGTKLAAGVDSLKFSGKPVANGSNITLGDGDSAKSYDIHIEGIAEDNTQPITVYLGPILDKNISDTSLKLYHEDALMTRVDSVDAFASNNQYTYDPATGDLVIYVDNFSVFSSVTTEASVWDGETVADGFESGTGTEADPFVIETAAQFAYFRNQVDGGVTFDDQFVKLSKDIDLADKLFDPIGFGYWNESKVDAEGNDTNTVFMGTFDGGNHTIYNLYENCWELDPDKTNYSTYTYSTAGAGLFASIKDATIKNLAISGAEVVFECVDMGVLVGYAQGECHFENIVVTDANIANYNRYTGGLVGEVSYGVDTDEDGFSHTFKNITVDSTVKVSGLWGSFGCGMGGVIGGKWGSATVKMENVVSAAEMDVYNDVVSAYQWYAFRGCGMLIGHTEEPYSDGRHSGNATASFLTCENVKVYYGDWVNYHYYEFENQDNATGRNYPWVRAEEGNYCDAFSNIRYGVPTHNGVKVSDLTEEELKDIATDYTPIVFDQLYGADRGMYGTANHEGVTVFKKNVKTVYIHNNSSWTNLKLDYWYKNGEDTWTNVVNGIDLRDNLLENNVYKIEVPIYAEGFKITADDENVKEFVVSDVANNGFYTLEGTHEHDFSVNNTCICGCKKVIVNIAEYAANNGWNNATQYSTISANEDITITSTGGSNTGKLYGGDNWRIYQSDSGKVTITSANGNILSVMITYDIDNTGTLTLNSTNVASKTIVDVNDTSVTFGVGNTGAVFNGIVQITKIEVVYSTVLACDHKQTVTETKAPTCTEAGYTATKCVECGKVMSKTDGDSATGHDFDGVVTKEPTCTETGLKTYTCSVCQASYTENISAKGHLYGDGVVTTNATCTTEGEKTYTCETCSETKTETIDALGHNYVDGACLNCGAAEPTEPETPATNKYYIATKRSTGNYYYMTSDLGTASTKRYTAVDSGLTTLPTSISSPKEGYVFVLIDNGDGTYSIQAEGVDGNNYLGWTSGNSGTLVAEANALKLTVEVNNGVYNIHFAASDAERYLALNGTSGNNYFAWYKSGQKQDLVLIPVVDGGSSEPDTPACEHANTTTTTVEATCTEAGSVTVTCNDCDEIVSTETIVALGHKYNDGVCSVCGAEDPNAGGTTEPTVVLEITTADFNSTSYAANNNTKTEGDYSYTSYQVMLQSNAMQWQKSKGYITIESNEFDKLELKATAGTFTVTVGGSTVTGTTSNGVTTYDLSGLTGEIKISVGSVLGKTEYLKFYK